MSTKRRIIVEIIAPGAFEGRTSTVDYDARYESSMASAIEAVIDLSFAPIEGERSYVGWSRCTINVSPPICQAEGGDCWNILEHEDEKATQVCWQCHMAAGGEE